MNIKDDRPNVEIKTVSTKDKYGISLVDFVARVAATAAADLHADTLGVFELVNDRIARVGYWERTYIVLWQNSREWGTHRACINGDGDSMLVSGNFFRNIVDATDDFFVRSRY